MFAATFVFNTQCLMFQEVHCEAGSGFAEAYHILVCLCMHEMVLYLLFGTFPVPLRSPSCAGTLTGTSEREREKDRQRRTSKESEKSVLVSSTPTVANVTL